MIIGYQVISSSGELFNKGPENLILSEATAKMQMIKAKENGLSYRVVAIFSGQIENPIFEIPLLSSIEQYKVLSVSTVHLSPLDRELLDDLSEDALFSDMYFRKDTGWFVRQKKNQRYFDSMNQMSTSLKSILTSVFESGYCMVEFDCDALEYRCFKTFKN